jgi:AcrR family transcriptional regulator
MKRRKPAGAGAGRAGRGRRAENKDKTRRTILGAALAMFRKKGFYRTTTKEISAKAGIAEGTLFNYFRTKEDLALYYVEAEVDALMDWFPKQSELARASLPEQLFAVTHRFLERIAPYEEFIGAVYLRALQPASKLSPISLEQQALNLRFLRFVRGLMAQAEARKEIPPVGDFGAYAFGLFHLAMVTYWLHDTSPGKENTLAALDRSLHMAKSVAKRGGWEW